MKNMNNKELMAIDQALEAQIIDLEITRNEDAKIYKVKEKELTNSERQNNSLKYELKNIQHSLELESFSKLENSERNNNKELYEQINKLNKDLKIERQNYDDLSLKYDELEKNYNELPKKKPFLENKVNEMGRLNTKLMVTEVNYVAYKEESELKISSLTDEISILKIDLGIKNDEIQNYKVKFREFEDVISKMNVTIKGTSSNDNEKLYLELQNSKKLINEYKITNEKLRNQINNIMKDVEKLRNSNSAQLENSSYSIINNSYNSPTMSNKENPSLFDEMTMESKKSKVNIANQPISINTSINKNLISNPLIKNKTEKSDNALELFFNNNENSDKTPIINPNFNIKAGKHVNFMMIYQVTRNIHTTMVKTDPDQKSEI